MSAVVCTCPRDQLCADCVSRHVMWARGMAYGRGDTWASSVAARSPRLLAQPWPELKPGSKARAIAERKIADMTPDDRVREQLLAHFQDGARRAWLKLQAARRPPR